jgi:hypothetical protein
MDPPSAVLHRELHREILQLNRGAQAAPTRRRLIQKLDGTWEVVKVSEISLATLFPTPTR